MLKFYFRVFVYLLCFVIALYGLSAFDFNRFVKKNKIAAAWVLYFCIAMALAYLLGQFLMAIIYWFNI